MLVHFCFLCGLTFSFSFVQKFQVPASLSTPASSTPTASESESSSMYLKRFSHNRYVCGSRSNNWTRSIEFLCNLLFFFLLRNFRWSRDLDCGVLGWRRCGKLNKGMMLFIGFQKGYDTWFSFNAGNME
jgi:hypothetical protein